MDAVTRFVHKIRRREEALKAAKTGELSKKLETCGAVQNGKMTVSFLYHNFEIHPNVGRAILDPKNRDAKLNLDTRTKGRIQNAIERFTK